MTRIILCGCCGKMGQNVIDSAALRNDIEIVAGVDVADNDSLHFPVFHNFDEISVKADVIIDFSNVSILDSLLNYACKSSTPLVLATTGLSEDQINSVKKAAESIPLFFTYNMSLGINLICELSKKAAKVLGNSFDIEIVEAHHNRKLDAPSGTALMLADTIKEMLPDSYYEYDRHSKREKRSENEIGIHSIRGGNIVGEHEVIFAGENEIIKISHSARSRAVFAEGAINAAVYLKNQKSGLYDMAALLADAD